MPPAERDLQGLRVLIVEDDYDVVELLVYELESYGIAVVGPISNVRRGLEVLDSEFAIDFALVDVNLGGTAAYPLIDRLVERDVPLVLVSGYDSQALPERYRGLPSRLKPCDSRQLLDLMRQRPNAPSLLPSP